MKSRICLATGIVATVGALWALASPPTWWTDRVEMSGEASPKSPVNLGQLKNMAHHLHAEMEEQLPGGAGFELTSLFPAPPTDVTQEWIDAQKVAVNLGQLKYVAQPFYDRLNAIAPNWVQGEFTANGLSSWPHLYPWDPETPVAENKAVANQGQLKLVFSLRLREDADADGLPDVVEHALHSSIAENAASSDYDYDGIADATEYGSGGTSAVMSYSSPTGVAGQLTVDRWPGVPLYVDTVEDFYSSDNFFEQPEVALTDTTQYDNAAGLRANDAVRLRGYITAPTSGYYYFWVSSRRSSDLWLSSDNTKFKKKRIARIHPDEFGAFSGVSSDDPSLWDRYASQMSAAIYLEEGEQYFIEAYNKQADNTLHHLSLAWAPPEELRVPIPISVMTSYAAEAADSDDDYLPDAWELKYGLDPTDNGAISREREGERGDFDQDGLSNRDEYIYGTNPANADSDGDGLSDGIEVHGYDSDPNEQNTSDDEVPLFSIDLATVDQQDDYQLTSHGLVGNNFRGEVSWEFETASAGFYNIDVSLGVLGDVFASEHVKIDAYVDEVQIPTENTIFGVTRKGRLVITSPHLEVGAHTLKLFIDNRSGRRTIAIENISITEASQDWVDNLLAEQNTLLPYPATSRTSPAFVEGACRILPHVDGTIASEGVTNTSWFADVDLEPDGNTSFEVAFENQFTRDGRITWISTNILDGESLTVRKGDTLKLTAVPSTGVTGQAARIVIPSSENLALNADAVATQSSTVEGGVASRAIDGITDRIYDNGSVTQTDNEEGAWWQVDLGAEFEIKEVRLFNRGDNVAFRLSNYRVSVIDDSGATTASIDYATHETISQTWNLPQAAVGRVIRVERIGPDSMEDNILSLAEVEVFGDHIINLNSDDTHHIYRFDDAGETSFTATHANGDTATLNVTVKQADFDQAERNLISKNINTGSFSGQEFDLAKVDPDLFFDAEPAVGIDPAFQLHEADQTFSLRMLARTRGKANLLARLYRGGPVVGVQPLNLVGLSNGHQTELAHRRYNDDYPGHFTITIPIVVSDLPEGGYVQVVIFRGGVFFAGTQMGSDAIKVLNLYNGGVFDENGNEIQDFVNFDENGVAYIDFVYTSDIEGGYCHYLNVFDAEGNSLIEE